VGILQAKGVKLKLGPTGAPTEIAVAPNIPMTLDDYKRIGQFTGLIRADLSAKDLPLNDETVVALSKLDKLENLFANGAEISDEGMKAFAGLKSLKRLGFDHWGWKIAKNSMLGSGLVHLAGLTNLQAVRFGGCRIDDRACEALAKVKSLESIDFFHSQVRDAGIGALKALPKLRVITLSPQFDPRITDQALVHLGEIKTLEEIVIHETWLTYENGFVHLKKLTALKKMSLPQVVATDEDIAKLKADHPGMELTWTKPDAARAEKVMADYRKRANEAKGRK
jgi:hypothetical protein